ncbi:MAG: hypothetical protein PVH68_02770, partial [Armatimonadota bacterium]
MRHARPILMIVGAILTATLACPAQPLTDVVDVTSFRDLVTDRGEETEDWQPAFQAAIARARETRQPIHVPTGEYRIRRAIEIVPVEVEGKPFLRNAIRMFGAGKMKSIISQQVETENCINWTGLEYEKPCTHGSLEDICLRGGTV